MSISVGERIKVPNVFILFFRAAAPPAPPPETNLVGRQTILLYIPFEFIDESERQKKIFSNNFTLNKLCMLRYAYERLAVIE